MTGSTRVASQSVGSQQAYISLLIPRFAGSGVISRKKNLKDKDEARSDQQSGPFQSAIRLCRMISSAPQILELRGHFGIVFQAASTLFYAIRNGRSMNVADLFSSAQGRGS
ncbi:hypothetical protein PABG_05935 [Paracoccidioides brasiliensis Pb03]|nr:hypothetical protein PABG_05935 [Paracoccidioides brasiliensis Pb03]